MDFNERVIPEVSANFLFKEALARYEFAVSYLKKGVSLLDIGCGTGYGAAQLGKKGVNVIGIDHDKEAINYAKKRFGNQAIFKLGIATNLKFSDDSFDTIVSFELIEHLKNPVLFLKEVKRVLKTSGRLILSTPNGYITSRSGLPRSSYHIKEYEFDEILALVKKVFRKVEIRGQAKSPKAKEALRSFMDSQKTREAFVAKDSLGIRKLFPRWFKEKVWKHLGSFYGRLPQDGLQTNDFPISKSPIQEKDANKFDYFIILCTK